MKPCGFLGLSGAELIEARASMPIVTLDKGLDEVALGVAGVNQDQIGLFGAQFFNLSYDLAQATRQAFCITGVVPGHESAMQV